MSMRRHRLVVGVLLVACNVGCSAANLQDRPMMELTSTAFADGASIPSEHTCDGADTSPPLAWSDVPDGTAAFAVLVEDPDAGGFVHWVLSDVPGDRRELAAGDGDATGVPGRNDFRRNGWGGPCPPSGEHRYAFTLYALDVRLNLSEGASADEMRSAMTDHVLAEGRLTGVYTRGR